MRHRSCALVQLPPLIVSSAACFPSRWRCSIAVVFLDADTIVVRNMDEAFGCPGFCAAMRHSERLNSGVLVVEPSTHVFRDMLSKIAQLPSYTG